MLQLKYGNNAQAVLDMTAKKLTSQAYTKVPNFAWVFGGTGIKINLSLLAEGDGLNPDGTLRFSSKEGMDFDEAMRLRDRYSENVGTILVGVSDDHIRAAMADPRIDYIIPFHRSGWGEHEMELMTKLRDYTDYQSSQNERRIVGYTKDGKPTKTVTSRIKYARLARKFAPRTGSPLSLYTVWIKTTTKPAKMLFLSPTPPILLTPA